jgi:hypothetical protein
MCIGLRVKYPLCFLNYDQNWIFSTGFRKIIIYQISRKSVPWEPSCCMRTNRQEGRTDRHDEANSPFSQCCESAWKETRTACMLLSCGIWRYAVCYSLYVATLWTEISNTIHGVTTQTTVTAMKTSNLTSVSISLVLILSSNINAWT